MKTNGFGKASGKIILIGEHAAVYYEPAVVIPFTETQINTQILPCDKLEIDCEYFTGLLSDVPEKLLNLQALVAEFLDKHNRKEERFKIKIESSIPSERGIGSSAAVAVSMVRALADYFDMELSSDEQLYFANFSEKIAHGNPSGMDVATIASSKPLLFIKGLEPEYFPMNLTDTYLLVADTGQKGQTKQVVSDVAQLIQDQPEKMNHIKELGKLSLQAKTAIIENDKHTLGKIFNLAQEHLQELTVSNARLDKFCQLAYENGALGAKLTGSGRGGCMIVLSGSKENAEKIAETFTQEGIDRIWIQEIGAK